MSSGSPVRGELVTYMMPRVSMSSATGSFTSFDGAHSDSSSPLAIVTFTERRAASARASASAGSRRTRSVGGGICVWPARTGKLSTASQDASPRVAAAATVFRRPVRMARILPLLALFWHQRHAHVPLPGQIPSRRLLNGRNVEFSEGLRQCPDARRVFAELVPRDDLREQEVVLPAVGLELPLQAQLDVVH